MELRDRLILERYRLVIDRQRYFTGLARDAFATYAKFAAGIAAIVVTLLSARESLGLDKALMPDLISILGCLLMFLGLVAVVQIVAATVRWRRYRELQAELDPDTPRLHLLWWFAEAVYLLVISASLVFGWRALDALARVSAR